MYTEAMSKPEIRIVITDDHPIFRAGLRLLLKSQPDFRLVGEAGDGQDGLRMVSSLKPDILLLDKLMPGIDGLELLRQLNVAETSTKCILLTGTINDAEIVQALQLGARGIVLKDSVADILFACIRKVHAGEYWVGRGYVTSLVEAIKKSLQNPESPAGRNSFGLTQRELAVLTSVSAGRTNKEVAESLSISEQTVKNHITAIFNKTGVSNRVELCVFAIRNGLSGE
jgi:two-component system nitrate/nitrite response regulator NarL